MGKSRKSERVLILYEHKQNQACKYGKTLRQSIAFYQSCPEKLESLGLNFDRVMRRDRGTCRTSCTGPTHPVGIEQISFLLSRNICTLRFLIFSPPPPPKSRNLISRCNHSKYQHTAFHIFFLSRSSR